MFLHSIRCADCLDIRGDVATPTDESESSLKSSEEDIDGKKTPEGVLYR